MLMLTDLRGRQFDLLVRIQKRRPWYQQRGFLIGCLNPALDTRRATVAWNLALQSHMDTRHIKEKSIFYTTTLTLLLRYINFQFEQVWIKVSISLSSSSTRCPSSVCSSLASVISSILGSERLPTVFKRRVSFLGRVWEIQTVTLSPLWICAE